MKWPTCLRFMLLRSTRKRRPQSSEVLVWMWARSFFERASRSACGSSREGEGEG